MLKIGLSIDDYDEDLGYDDDLTMQEVADEGLKMEGVDQGLHAEVVVFSYFLGTARVLLGAVRGRSDCSWQSDDTLGPLVSDTRAGRVAPTPGVSSWCWATCQIALQVVDLCCL